MVGAAVPADRGDCKRGQQPLQQQPPQSHPQALSEQQLLRQPLLGGQPPSDAGPGSALLAPLVTVYTNVPPAPGEPIISSLLRVGALTVCRRCRSAATAAAASSAGGPFRARRRRPAVADARYASVGRQASLVCIGDLTRNPRS